jgi:uncharacterized membrane protein YfcA
MGLVVSFAAPLLHLAAGEWPMDQAAGFLIIPLGDMVLFGGFFGAAILYRRKPEIHKRLILLATVALLFAAIGRLSFVLGRGPVALLAWLSPLLVAMAYDGLVSRRVRRTCDRTGDPGDWFTRVLFDPNGGCESAGSAQPLI